MLLDDIKNVDRAAKFAKQCNEGPVWSLLAKAQLDKGRPDEAIDAYVKAEDAGDIRMVLKLAKEQGRWAKLVTYLNMAKKDRKTSYVTDQLAAAEISAGGSEELGGYCLTSEGEAL